MQISKIVVNIHESNKKSYRPDVTSTSTGTINICCLFSLFVRIRIKAVWLLSTRPIKLAFMIAFVSNGGISCHNKHKHSLNATFFQNEENFLLSMHRSE